MSFSIETVKTVYDTFVTAKTATAAAHAAIVALGSYPTFPLKVIADADYNNIVTALGTWTTSYNSLYGTYQTALAAQRTAELAVITAIQTGSGATQGADEWYQLTGAGSGPLTYTNWIGYSSKDTARDGGPFLVIETSLPTQSFLNSNS